MKLYIVMKDFWQWEQILDIAAGKLLKTESNYENFQTSHFCEWLLPLGTTIRNCYSEKANNGDVMNVTKSELYQVCNSMWTFKHHIFVYDFWQWEQLLWIVVWKLLVCNATFFIKLYKHRDLQNEVCYSFVMLSFFPVIIFYDFIFYIMIFYVLIC